MQQLSVFERERRRWAGRFCRILRGFPFSYEQYREWLREHEHDGQYDGIGDILSRLRRGAVMHTLVGPDVPERGSGP